MIVLRLTGQALKRKEKKLNFNETDFFYTGISVILGGFVKVVAYLSKGRLLDFFFLDLKCLIFWNDSVQPKESLWQYRIYTKETNT